MNKDINWYIQKFLNKMKTEGLTTAFYATYSYCMKDIMSRLSSPKARRISLLRILSIFPWRARRKAIHLIGDYLNTTCSLDGAYSIVRGSELNFSNTEVVLLAHWDPENIVDPYVLYMAKHLKQLRKKIVLCSTAPLAELPDLDVIDAIVCRTCGGYDFTSWKAAFDAFPSLYEAKELTLCNDSVFAPIGSYEQIYQKMALIPCDFWGLTFSYEIMPHIQSFFLVLRKHALQHQAFKHFISAISVNQNHEEAVGYEVRFSLWLELHGLQAACYRPYNLVSKIATNPMKKWERCLHDGIPLLKRELFKTQGRIAPLPRWKHIVESYNYPAQLIINYFNRIGIDISPVLCPGQRHSTWPPSVFACYKQLVLPREKLKKYPLRIAAIIHCYYHESLPTLIKYLINLPLSTHIYISTDTKEKQFQIYKQIAPIGFSKIEIRIFPNKGWDIAPFLVGFQDVISQYEIICKIHVKRSTYLPEEISNYWRTMLYESLLGSKLHVGGLLQLFLDNQKLGIVAPPSLPYSIVDMESNIKILMKLFQRMKLHIPRNEAIDFPVGSMFWARSAALQPLLDLHLSFDDFDITDPEQRDGSLAHAIERIFLFSCCKAKYYWGRVTPQPTLHTEILNKK